MVSFDMFINFNREIQIKFVKQTCVKWVYLEMVTWNSALQSRISSYQS